MIKKIGTGKAHGKIILGGEHSVVHGMPALVLPMPLEVIVNAQTMNGGLEVDIWSKDFPKNHRQNHPDFEGYVQMVSFIKAKLSCDLPIQIKIQSEIPIRSGLGSSAAVANAMAESVITLITGGERPQLKTEAVALAEKFAHGNPSGVDAAGTQCTRPVLFQKRKGIDLLCPVNMQGTFYFVVALSGVYVSTREVVEQVSAYFGKHPLNKSVLLTAFSKVVKNMVKCLSEGDSLKLGFFMNENHNILNTLGVSSKKLETMVAMALAQGALGAKLSGKGLGGAVIALVKSESDMVALVDFFLKKGILHAYPLVLNE